MPTNNGIWTVVHPPENKVNLRASNKNEQRASIDELCLVLLFQKLIFQEVVTTLQNKSCDNQRLILMTA